MSDARPIQDVMRDLRKQQIITAARTLIGRRGYEPVTMSRIAVAAAVSRSTLYAYFKNKDAIVREAFTMGQGQLADRMAELDLEEGDVRAHLIELIATTFRYFDEHRAFFLAVVAQAYRGASSLGEDSLAVGALGQGLSHRIAEALLRGVEDGIFRPHDVEESSFVLTLTVQGAVGARVRRERTGEAPESTAAVLVDYFLRGITANRS
jgi:AcrR family transcriptional regulator